MYESILSLIQQHDTIILHRHTKPDGDALGSQIGLKHILLENFPEKTVYMVGDSAGSYGFLEDSVMDTVPDEAYSDALAIILDCGAAHLISDDRYRLARHTVRFDHHIFVAQIAQEEAVDTSFESCCGLIAHFAQQCGLRLNPLAAKSLYTGMVTDSGRFRYDATTARTHSLAAFLMEKKFDTNELYRQLYAETLESKLQKAQFILKIQLTEHNVAYIYNTAQEVAASGMDTFRISRGMVNLMADIKGVSIWVNFTESEEGVLCELRSNALNINPIAVKYGGGGHAKASGACVADRQTAMAMLEDLDNMIGENQ